METIYDNQRQCFLYPDGSIKMTKEQYLNLNLLNEKWKMRNFEGKGNIDEMIKDFEDFERRKK